jgi:hypothetical protein
MGVAGQRRTRTAVGGFVGAVLLAGLIVAPADLSINGGGGVNTAYYDLGVDPNPVATESKIPA